MTQLVQQMIQKWHGLMGPATQTMRPENPVRHGTYQLDSADHVPEAVIRGFIVKMTNLLLTQTRKFRGSLANMEG